MIPGQAARDAVHVHGAGHDCTELAVVLGIVTAMHPKIIVEIGCNTGGGLYAWASTGAEVIGLSLPPPGGQGCEAHGAHLITGDSHDPGSQERLAERLDGRSPDFVWIDGDHTEKGCRFDWQLAQRFRPRAVGFHDISPRRIPGDPGVRKVWAEAAARYPSVVIRNPSHPDNPGAGIVWLTSGECPDG